MVHSKFIAIWRHNVNQQVIANILSEIKDLQSHANRHLIQNYECILFAFSGHGLNNRFIVMQTGQQVDVQNDILNPLLPSSIPKFGKVPKILLIDACRGGNTTDTVSTKSHLALITKDTIPATGNYLLACATMPWHYSYMDRERGSIWMQEVALRLRTSLKTIGDVLIDVNIELLKRADKGEILFQQTEIYTLGLAKEVRINRGTSNVMIILCCGIAILLLAVVGFTCVCRSGKHINKKRNNLHYT